MTLLKPTLQVKGLAVYKDQRAVLAIQFHSGINVVRGHNSSGKTTVMDFLAYALGAENIPWKTEASLCDEVVVEVALNGSSATFRRYVNDRPLNPLQVFWGPAEIALSAAVTSWEQFPFKRTTNKLSFTQAIFAALDLPEAQGDGASNLTMHQLLRVMYADQPSLHSPIFRTDSFDNALTRETVGNYLCGVYDDKLYVLQLERRDLEKESAVLQGELRSIYRVLAASGKDVNFEFMQQQLIALRIEEAELQRKLVELRARRSESRDPAVKEISTIRAQLSIAKSEVVQAEEELTRLELEMADSKRFISELELRLATLEESTATRAYFGEVQFSYCPCCLSELDGSAASPTTCPLCKSPSRNEAADTQLLRMKNELRIQQKESESIAQRAAERVSELRIRLPGLRQNLKNLETRFRELTSTWSTEVEEALEVAVRRLGAIEHENRTLTESHQLGLVIGELQQRVAAMAERGAQIDEEIELLTVAQEERKREATLTIARTLSRLLKMDLYRQEEFRSADNVQFSFVDNEISVDGATQFSESSTVVLRHLFHLALLEAADALPAMRLPRFMMLDGVEDGGMELPRAHRLQEIILDETSRFKNEFQLIIATSQISPALDKAEYVVGRNFSEDRRSLDIQRSSADSRQ